MRGTLKPPVTKPGESSKPAAESLNESNYSSKLVFRSLQMPARAGIFFFSGDRPGWFRSLNKRASTYTIYSTCATNNPICIFFSFSFSSSRSGSLVGALRPHQIPILKTNSPYLPPHPFISWLRCRVLQESYPIGYFPAIRCLFPPSPPKKVSHSWRVL